MSGPPPPSPIASAEMLAVGAELLVGETRDTNSGHIAAALTALGVEVVRTSQLPDDRAVLATAIREAIGRADLVITSGGLGPTPDDLTREAIADAVGDEPVVDPELEKWLRGLWAGRGMPFSDVNLKQAWLVPGATALPNPHGTAPGWWVERGPTLIVALPGPPRELQPMWREHVLPRLQARGLGLDRAATTLHLTGVGESALVDVVGKELLERENPRMATYARADFVDLRVSAVATAEQTAQALVADAVASLSPRLDPYVFGHDDDSWTDALLARLGDRRLATAECGTGGYLTMLLGSTPFLAHAELDRALVDVVAAASALRQRYGTAVGMAVSAQEADDDMRVSVGLDIEGRTFGSERTTFRGGDMGRRRSANAAISELWRRLAD